MEAPRPFDQLRETLRNHNKENKELLTFVFEKSDSIFLWIIGLAIGGIAIFANNIADIQKSINPQLLKPILILLAISVAAGIIYRGLFLYFFVVLTNIQRSIDISLSNEQSMDTESVLNGDETFPQVVKKVKNNIGDLSHLIQAYKVIDDNAKQTLYKGVVDQYIESVEFAQRDTALAFDFIADTYAVSTGTTKEKFLKKLNNPNLGSQYKWTYRATMLFYLLYLLTFIAALFLFVCAL